MKIVIYFVALCFCCHAMAQKSNIHFSSSANIGLMIGEVQQAASFQTINGIRIHKWRFGIGTGLDNYGIKSIPLFLDIRHTYGTKKWKNIVYANGGIDFPLYNDYFKERSQLNGYYQYTYKLYNSLCGEAGIGLSRALSKKLSLNLTAGFSYKHFSYLETRKYTDVLGNKINNQYDFYYRRLALRVGLQF